MEPKLIPIVTTAAEADAVELVQTYTRRWPAQENVIRDWLIPLGIDVNHDYAKTPDINSEVAKKRGLPRLRQNDVVQRCRGRIVLVSEETEHGARSGFTVPCEGAALNCRNQRVTA